MEHWNHGISGVHSGQGRSMLRPYTGTGNRGCVIQWSYVGAYGMPRPTRMRPRPLTTGYGPTVNARGELSSLQLACLGRVILGDD